MSRKDRIQRLKNLKPAFSRVILNNEVTAFKSVVIRRQRPKWWLHGIVSSSGKMRDEMLDKIYTHPISRCSWAWLIGRTLCEDEDTALLFGAVHCWPMWIQGCPADLLPDLAELANHLVRCICPPNKCVYSFATNQAKDHLGFLYGPKQLQDITGVQVNKSHIKDIAIPVLLDNQVMWVKPASTETAASASKTAKVLLMLDAESKTFQINADGTWEVVTDIKDSTPVYLCLIRNMMRIALAMNRDLEDASSLCVVTATVPCLLNGATAESTPKIEKHFNNFAMTFGLQTGDVRPYARVAHKVWPHLQALLSTPGAAQGVMTMMKQQEETCIWFKILAERMEGYGFTALQMIISAILLFPMAPWSMFFNRSDWEAEEYSLETLGIKPPYARWNKFVKWCQSNGYMDKAIEPLGEHTTEDEARKILLPAYLSLCPRPGEFPELELQGDKFLEDYERWAKNSLIMYTGIEGLSNTYPDLAYFAVQLIKRWYPGSQIAGYRGAPESRCKMLTRIKRVLDSFGELMEAISIDDRLLDLTIGPKLAEVLKGESAFTSEDKENLYALLPQVKEPTTSRSRGKVTIERADQDDDGTGITDPFAGLHITSGSEDTVTEDRD